MFPNNLILLASQTIKVRKIKHNLVKRRCRS